MRVPVAANGWPAASDEPLTLSLSRSIEPSGAFAFDFSYEPPRRLDGDLLYSPLDGFLDRYKADTGTP